MLKAVGKTAVIVIPHYITVCIVLVTISCIKYGNVKIFTNQSAQYRTKCGFIMQKRENENAKF